MALRSISLCSGVGGLDLGLRLATDVRTVCYVEWDKFPAAVIAARIKDGCLDDAPVWDDVTTFDGRPWRGRVDLVAAGFPCQPVSLAGQRKGMDDHRFIWGDIWRIIAEVQPRYVFLENVPGIVTADRGAFLDAVLGSLVALGFDCEWDVFSAEETGAPHRRQRWFCLAHANIIRNGEQHDYVAPIHEKWKARETFERRGVQSLANPRHGLIPQSRRESQGRDGAGPASAVLGDAEGGARLGPAPGDNGHAALTGQKPVADTEYQQWDGTGVAWNGRGQPANDRVYPPARSDHAGWADTEASLEPAVCRDVDGLAPGMDPSLFAYRQDRLRAVGNGVVPLTAALAWIELSRRAGCLT